MRASGMPICSAAMVALQAPSIEANGQTADEDRLGDAVEPQRELVMTPSVPSEPIRRRVRS